MGISAGSGGSKGRRTAHLIGQRLRQARACLFAATAAWSLVPGAVQSAQAVGLKPDLPRGAAGLVKQVAIFGTDDRKPLPAELRRLRGSIGLIYNGSSRTICTAFCVADNIIATASHCIYRTKGERPPPASRFVFTRPGLREAPVRISGANRGAAAQQIISGIVGISTKPPIDAALDWALVRLERPVCKGRALELQPLSISRVAEEAARGRLGQVAYHRDFGDWTMAYSNGCRVEQDGRSSTAQAARRDFSNAAHLILHTCDTAGASSGSPLLLFGATGPRVVAINVGTFVRSQAVLKAGSTVRRLPSYPVANTAVSATAFADKLAILRSASILTSPRDLRALQDNLSVLRLYRGPLDGRFGSRMRAAIHEYEARRGGPTTGLPTSTLLRQLKGTASISQRHR
jgi:hypothetical protein